MADETSQQTQAQGAAPTGEGSVEAAEAKSGGFMAYLPLVLAVVLMPGLALGTFKLKSVFDKKPASKPAEEEAVAAKETEDSHGGGHGTSKAAAKIERDVRLPVPLTRLPIAYRAADKTKPGDQNKYVILDLKGDAKDVAQADKIVVNIARTGGMRFAATRVLVVSESPDFLDRLNRNRERLIDIASGALSSKTLEEIDTPGFKGLFRGELLAAFNRAMGGNYIHEVIIDEVVVQ